MGSTAELVTLSTLNWLHLGATVVWIGGIFLNNLAVSPSARQSLEPPVMGKFMSSYIKRFRVLVYISVGILVVTGVIMTIMNPQYAGLAVLGNLWLQLVLVKHIFVVILIILGIYILEVLTPKIGRLGAKGPSPELGKLQKKLASLGITTLIIATIILVFTAITGAISALA